MQQGDGVVEWAWQRQAVWSSVADELRHRTQRTRTALLGLTVLGATCALASSQLRPAHLSVALFIGAVGTLSLAGAGLLASVQNVEDVKRWTIARAASEAIKSQVYLRLTSVEPYDVEEKDRVLDASVQDLEREATQRGVVPTPSASVRARPIPHISDLETYVDLRVRKSQLQGYYVPRAAAMRRRLTLFKRVGVALVLLAAILAALTSVSPTTGAWASLITTVAGVVAAHAAGEHYETLWIEYSRTADELHRLVDRRTAADGTVLTGDELIKRCEAVISAQNRAWLATWGSTVGDV